MILQVEVCYTGFLSYQPPSTQRGPGDFPSRILNSIKERRPKNSGLPGLASKNMVDDVGKEYHVDNLVIASEE